MRGRFRHGQREGSWYIYYDCVRKGTEFGADRCRARPVNGKRIEALVWHEVKTALSSPGAILAALEGRPSDTLDEELGAVKKEIDRLRKQEGNLIYMFQVGEYDEELLERATRKLKKSQGEAARRYDELKDQQVRTAQAIESVETYCEWASRNLENLDFEEKRLVLEALDIQVTVQGTRVIMRGFLPISARTFSPTPPLPKKGLRGLPPKAAGVGRSLHHQSRPGPYRNPDGVGPSPPLGVALPVSLGVP